VDVGPTHYVIYHWCCVVLLGCSGIEDQKLDPNTTEMIGRRVHNTNPICSNAPLTTLIKYFARSPRWLNCLPKRRQRAPYLGRCPITWYSQESASGSSIISEQTDRR
jgi:hypothetical protein